MKSAVVILVFSCALLQFGSDAAITLKQIQNISALAQPSLAVIPLPDSIDKQMKFKPFQKLLPFKIVNEIVVFPALVTITNGVVLDVNTYRVTDNDVVFSLANPERLNITIRIMNLPYQFNYIFKSFISNAGEIDGLLKDVKIIIPVDTTNNVITIVGPVGFDFRKQELKFSKGEPLQDVLFNLLSSIFYNLAREIMEGGYVEYIAAEIIKSFNTVAPQVLANQ